MFYQIFFSPQVKQYAIITYKNGIYDLPYELQNDLDLGSWKIRKYHENVKIS